MILSCERTLRLRCVRLPRHRSGSGVIEDSVAHALVLRLSRLRFEDTADLDTACDLLRSQAESAPDAPNSIDERLKVMISHVEKSIDTKIQVSVLAGKVGLSESYFSRLFSSQMGMSPHRYVAERRLARAQRLIETTQFSLADVAYRCGYCSQSHMTKSFSQYVGHPPGRLRRRGSSNGKPRHLSSGVEFDGKGRAFN